jgi:branched-chain amino acid transport system permease protein
MSLIQLLIDGIASGCIYGLVALGFVLIYKATETINFAQGDILMLGAFVAFSLIGVFELPYILGFLLTVIIIGSFGFALDAGGYQTSHWPTTICNSHANHWLRFCI